jgi:hypothetical protein
MIIRVCLARFLSIFKQIMLFNASIFHRLATDWSPGLVTFDRIPEF